jgi:hypothetical protein
MTAITITAADVRVLRGAHVERVIINESMNVGAAVYVDGYSGDLPTVKKTTAAAVATSNTFGVIVSGPVDRPGVTALVTGDVVDCITYGRMTGLSGGTAGGYVFASDTAGVLADAAGTKEAMVGIMLTPTVLMVRPIQAARSA